MTSPNSGDSTVILTIPMRAEYVSIARLTAAGVANRLGFDIETIEDIKVSLSEVCNRLISTQSRISAEHGAECKIEFNLSSDSLGIDFFVDSIEALDFFQTEGDSLLGEPGGAAAGSFGGSVISADQHAPGDQSAEAFSTYNEDQLQLSLITLLMDEFIVNPNKSCLVSMKKYLE
ncbi:MAG: hypothetical protein FWH01_13040 [Oscillospiraceae bacterium]|nr:hypothetical protein [Oscillospiraceae bacterium]